MKAALLRLQVEADGDDRLEHLATTAAVIDRMYGLEAGPAG